LGKYIIDKRGCMTWKDDYSILIKKMEEKMASLAIFFAGEITCGPGCCSCCTISSVLAVEAEIIRQFLAEQPGVLKKIEKKKTSPVESSISKCPFLADSRCQIYPVRPVICRTHGHALAYVDHLNETIELSICEKNFKNTQELDPDHLLYMDEFNEGLGLINMDFCKANFLSPEKRIKMANIYK
jgi:uncharacterized protein